MVRFGCDGRVGGEMPELSCIDGGARSVGKAGVPAEHVVVLAPLPW